MNADISYDLVVAVTQSDSAIDPGIPGGVSYFSGLWVTAGGLLKFTDPAGNTPTINVLPGVEYHFKFCHVWSSTTTATGIYGGVKMP